MADDNQGSRTFLAIVLGGIVLALVIAAFFMYGHKGAGSAAIRNGPCCTRRATRRRSAGGAPGGRSAHDRGGPCRGAAGGRSARRGSARAAESLNSQQLGAAWFVGPPLCFSRRRFPLLRSSEVQAERGLLALILMLNYRHQISGKRDKNGAGKLRRRAMVAFGRRPRHGLLRRACGGQKEPGRAG